MVKNSRPFPQQVVLKRCGMGIVPKLVSGIRTRRLSCAPPQPPVPYELPEFMGIEVQVGLGRLEFPSSDVPEPLDHCLVRCVGTEPGNVLFDDIDSPTRDSDLVSRQSANRATGSRKIELSPADRSPCSQRP